MSDVPGHSTTSGWILQYASQHAFSGRSDPQSSAQRKICHIRHGFLLNNKQSRESTNIWKLSDRMTSAAKTDDSSFKCKNSNDQLIYNCSFAAQSQVINECNVNFYVCIPFLCTPKFHAKAPMTRSASESKFKAHCHDRAVCPTCMHTACNSMYFVRAAAVCTASKKQKYDLERTHNLSWCLQGL